MSGKRAAAHLCELCGRRMGGKTRHHAEGDTTYYVYITNPKHHQQQPWYAEHPKTLTVREDHLLPVVTKFFGERILGPHRTLYLNSDQG